MNVKYCIVGVNAKNKKVTKLCIGIEYTLQRHSTNISITCALQVCAWCALIVLNIYYHDVLKVHLMPWEVGSMRLSLAKVFSKVWLISTMIVCFFRNYKT